MKTRHAKSAALVAALLFSAVAIAAPVPTLAIGPTPGPAAPQATDSQGASGEQKVLTLADYPRWSRVSTVALSADGAWMTYAYAPNEGDSTLHVRELDGDRIYEATNGSGPQFSDDSAWVGFITSPPDETGGGRGGGEGRGGRASN